MEAFSDEIPNAFLALLIRLTILLLYWGSIRVWVSPRVSRPWSKWIVQAAMQAAVLQPSAGSPTES